GGEGIGMYGVVCEERAATGSCPVGRHISSIQYRSRMGRQSDKRQREDQDCPCAPACTRDGPVHADSSPYSSSSHCSRRAPIVTGDAPTISPWQLQTVRTFLSDQPSPRPWARRNPWSGMPSRRPPRGACDERALEEAALDGPSAIPGWPTSGPTAATGS